MNTMMGLLSVSLYIVKNYNVAFVCPEIQWWSRTYYSLACQHMSPDTHLETVQRRRGRNIV